MNKAIKKTTKKTSSKEPSKATYTLLITELKDRIQKARLTTAIAVNEHLMELYYDIGRLLAKRMKEEGWGAKTIDKISKDLSESRPDLSGFSPRNLRYMLKFFESYPTKRILQQVVAKLPWGHNLVLMDKLKDNKERLWYAQQAIKNGWSRNTLLIFIENALHKREGKAITNFKKTLPNKQSDLAQQITKDPYCFSFLSLNNDFRERELEQGLIDQIQNLLLELGQGFAFLGRQYRLEIEGKEYFLDLLFYHIHLRRYIIVELKTDEFQAEFAGKMNFYLNAVDDLLKTDNDNPSIGLILCKSKSKYHVEFALRGIQKPIGVSDYMVEITKKLPKELKGSLPTIEQIEAELGKE